MAEFSQGSHCESESMDHADIQQVFEAFDTDNLGYLTLDQFEKLGESMNLSTHDVQAIFDTLDSNKDGFIEQSEFVSSFNSLTGIMSDEGHMSPREEAERPEILITEDTSDMTGFNQNNNNNTPEDHDAQKLDTPTGYRRRASTPRTSSLRSKSWSESRRRKVRKSSLDTIKMNGEDGVYMANQGTWNTFAETLGEAVYVMSSYDGISEVYTILESIGNPELLRNYEAMVQGIVKEVTRVQQEMQDMEASFEKEREKTLERQTALEEEMESQITKEKEKRREDRKKADEESEEMKEQYENQIDQLQSAIKKLQKFDEKLSSSSPYEKEVEALREKIRKLNKENAALKNKLTEAETKMVVMHNDMKEMELSNQEKTLEYMRDEDGALDRDEERNRYSMEVESLHHNQRQLMDSNDTLREALEKTMKRRPVRHHNGYPMEQLASPEYSRSGRSSRASMLEMDVLAECDPGRNGLLVPEFDSGVGTIRDDFDDSETDWADDSYSRRARRMGRYPSNASWVSGGSRRTRSQRSHRRKRDYQPDSDENDITNASDITDDELKNISQSSTLSSGSRGRSSRGIRTPTSSRKVITPNPMLGHNKRMYKIVLCGDSGVGKTSFIFRVCRDEFHNFTKSTLGVDFQVKTIQLEHDKSISLQLWDTAGQERFRSISTSYFRRAEGVLLLYDCTNQTSFINVRDWMETITQAVPDGIPIMICGHKVDVRDEAEMDGKDVVSAQEGAQLAANYGVLFVETSAVDGCNVSNAVTMLARHIPLDDTEDSTSVKKLDAIAEKVEKQACCKQS